MKEMMDLGWWIWVYKEPKWIWKMESWRIYECQKPLDQPNWMSFSAFVAFECYFGSDFSFLGHVIQRGHVDPWIFVDFLLQSMFLWHPIFLHWQWYGWMKINEVERIWMVNFLRNSRMCAFVDLYQDHEGMKWESWIWWMDIRKDLKWKERMKELAV